MFVAGIFCFIFGLFAWLVYGSKHLIEEVQKDHALIDAVRTYKITDRQYWLCFDTIVGVFFIFMGLMFVWMFFSNPPRNNSITIVLMGFIIVLMMIGMSALMLYSKLHYRVLTKDRPVTFNLADKSITVGEKGEVVVFSLTDIELITDYTTKARINARYWEVRLKNGKIVLLDPRYWSGIATEKFFRGVPKQVIHRWIPWFKMIDL